VFVSTIFTTYAAEELVAASGFPGLATPRIDLITAAGVPPNKRSVWADFTIAAFTGYAGPLTPTVSAVYIPQSTLLVSVDLSDCVFNGPSAGAGVDVIGLIFHDTTATPVVYAVILFDGPLGLQIPTDRVTVDETLGLGITLNFSAEN
jgi:hypothetical protein